MKKEGYSKKHGTGKIGPHGTGNIDRHTMRPEGGHEMPASTDDSHKAMNKEHCTEGGFCAGNEPEHGPVDDNQTYE